MIVCDNHRFVKNYEELANKLLENKSKNELNDFTINSSRALLICIFFTYIISMKNVF